MCIMYEVWTMYSRAIAALGFGLSFGFVVELYFRIDNEYYYAELKNEIWAY